VKSLPFLVLALLLPLPAFSAVPDLSSAQFAEVYHLAPISEPQIAIPKKFHGTQILAGPKRLSQPDARAIAHDLQLIYPLDWPPLNCPFVIRCGLRFHLGNGNNVDVLLSPSCGEIHFLVGKELRQADMNGYREDLLRRLNRLFPGQPFQARKPTRPMQPTAPMPVGG
jgi:hypothetical protein